MSSTPNPASQMTEAFTQFWSDFMSRMGGAMPQQSPGPDAIKQMQRMFLDAMAKYADDYMRSPAFLQQLKQSMDNAMAMKQQVDTFIANSLKTMQMPSRQDANYTVEVLHGLERRISTRLDAIEERLGHLEEGGSAPRDSSHSSRNKPRSK